MNSMVPADIVTSDQVAKLHKQKKKYNSVFMHDMDHLSIQAQVHLVVGRLDLLSSTGAIFLPKPKKFFKDFIDILCRNNLSVWENNDGWLMIKRRKTEEPLKHDAP